MSCGRKEGERNGVETVLKEIEILKDNELGEKRRR